MLLFGIPLKSKKVSADWPRVEGLFNSTLRSIFNQTDPDFRVIVACHEVPRTPYADDPRLEIVPVDFPPPLFRDELMVDKHRKREVVAARLRGLGGAAHLPDDRADPGGWSDGTGTG